MDEDFWVNWSLSQWRSNQHRHRKYSNLLLWGDGVNHCTTMAPQSNTRLKRNPPLAQLRLYITLYFQHSPCDFLSLLWVIIHNTPSKNQSMDLLLEYIRALWTWVSTLGWTKTSLWASNTLVNVHTITVFLHEKVCLLFNQQWNRYLFLSAWWQRRTLNVPLPAEIRSYSHGSFAQTWT